MSTPIFQEILAADFIQLLAANLLEKGVQYKITDRADLGIILTATQPNKISMNGIGGFLNPDFDNIGVDVSASPRYAGVFAVTGVNPNVVQGVWYPAGESGSVTGDIWFWDGIHYQVTDDTQFNGTDPATNTAAYTVLLKGAPNVGYAEVWDIVIYNLFGIVYREDEWRNKITMSQATFQWGNPEVREIILESDWIGAIDCINQRGEFQKCDISTGARLTITNDFDAVFNHNTLDSSASITVENSNGNDVQACRFSGVGATLEDVAVSNKIAESGFSNFETTIDITGLTTIDLTAAGYQGIIHLTSSNATETVNLISNIPSIYPYKLYPAAGLTLTLTGSPVATAAVNEIILPTLTVVLNGDNGDWIELQSDGVTSYSAQQDAMNYI